MDTERTCPQCGGSNLGSQDDCMLCGAGLYGPPVGNSTPYDPPAPAPASHGIRVWLLGLLALVIIVGGILYGSGLLVSAMQDEDERPSWERFRLEPPDYIPQGEKGEFTRTEAAREKLVQDLVESGFSEFDARKVIEEMGAEEARQLIGGD